MTGLLISYPDTIVTTCFLKQLKVTVESCTILKKNTIYTGIPIRATDRTTVILLSSFRFIQNRSGGASSFSLNNYKIPLLCNACKCMSGY